MNLLFYCFFLVMVMASWLLGFRRLPAVLVLELNFDFIWLIVFGNLGLVWMIYPFIFHFTMLAFLHTLFLIG